MNARTVFGTAVLVLAMLAATPSAQGEEFYYVLVFGSQQIPPRAKYSHSFATFVRAVGTGPCAESYALEAHTISWLPRVLDIQVWAIVPEYGQNLGLDATLCWALQTDQRISVWGPYRIDADLYRRALEQIALLDSGRVSYKAIDTGYRSDIACNCIHAVGSVMGGNRVRVFSPSFGETASWFLARRMQPWILDDRRHDWVAVRLGLTRYPLVWRELGRPRPEVLRTVVRAVPAADR